MAEAYDEELMIGYLEGDLTTIQRAQFERQMAEDPALAQLISHLNADRDGLRRLPRVDPPPGLVDEVIQRSERRLLLNQDANDSGPNGQGTATTGATRQHQRRQPWVSYGAIAAILFMCAGVFIYSLQSPPPRSQTLLVDGSDADRFELQTPMDEARSEERLPRVDSLAEALPARGIGLMPEASNLGKVADADALVLDKKEKGFANGRIVGPQGQQMAILEEAEVADIVQAAGGPAALDPVEQPLLVEVNTDSADSTQQQLYAWAQINDVAIIPQAVEAMDESKPAMRPTRPTDRGSREVTLVVQEQQLSQLITELGRREGQTLVPDAGLKLDVSKPVVAQKSTALHAEAAEQRDAVSAKLAALSSRNDEFKAQSRQRQARRLAGANESLHTDAVTTREGDRVQENEPAPTAKFDWVSGVLEYQLPLVPQKSAELLAMARQRRILVRINEIQTQGVENVASETEQAGEPVQGRHEK